MPHSGQYVAPPRAPPRDVYYSQAPAPPPSHYTASRKSSSYTSSPHTSSRSGMTYAVTAQSANAPASSRRRVTFGRVDVREFRGGERGGTWRERVPRVGAHLLASDELYSEYPCRDSTPHDDVYFISVNPIFLCIEPTCYSFWGWPPSFYNLLMTASMTSLVLLLPPKSGVETWPSSKTLLTAALILAAGAV